MLVGWAKEGGRGGARVRGRGGARGGVEEGEACAVAVLSRVYGTENDFGIGAVISLSVQVIVYREERFTDRQQ